MVLFVGMSRTQSGLVKLDPDLGGSGCDIGSVSALLVRQESVLRARGGKVFSRTWSMLVFWQGQQATF